MEINIGRLCLRCDLPTAVCACAVGAWVTVTWPIAKPSEAAEHAAHLPGNIAMPSAPFAFATSSSISAGGGMYQAPTKMVPDAIIDREYDARPAVAVAAQVTFPRLPTGAYLDDWPATPASSDGVAASTGKLSGFLD